MASETMESALREFVERKTDNHYWRLSDRQFILRRLDNI
jgi:hypothetical protein